MRIYSNGVWLSPRIIYSRKRVSPGVNNWRDAFGGRAAICSQSNPQFSLSSGRSSFFFFLLAGLRFASIWRGRLGRRREEATPRRAIIGQSFNFLYWSESIHGFRISVRTRVRTWAAWGSVADIKMPAFIRRDLWF